MSFDIASENWAFWYCQWELGFFDVANENWAFWCYQQELGFWCCQWKLGFWWIICHGFKSWALIMGLNPIDKMVLPWIWIMTWVPLIKLLGSKTLGDKYIRTSLCIMLANYDQNIESRFRLAQSVFICKSWNQVIARFIGLNLQGSINRTLCRIIFCRIFQISPSLVWHVGFYVLLQV